MGYPMGGMRMVSDGVGLGGSTNGRSDSARIRRTRENGIRNYAMNQIIVIIA